MLLLLLLLLFCSISICSEVDVVSGAVRFFGGRQEFCFFVSFVFGCEAICRSRGCSLFAAFPFYLLIVCLNSAERRRSVLCVIDFDFFSSRSCSICPSFWSALSLNGDGRSTSRRPKRCETCAPVGISSAGRAYLGLKGTSELILSLSPSRRVPPWWVPSGRAKRPRTQPNPQGHRVLMGMVNAGIPLRESTKQEVPSLMPLPPTGQDGFEWHQRRRRRRPRRQQQQQQKGVSPRSPPSSAPAFATAELESGGLVAAGARGGGGGGGGRNGFEQVPEMPKKHLTTVELPKGVLNGEGCTAAAVAAAGGGATATAPATKDGEGVPGMGWLLANDLTSEMERGAGAGGLLALERKRHRMREFSQRKMEQQKKLERILRKEGADDVRVKRGVTTSGVNGGVNGEYASRAAAGAAQIDSRPGGRRGRNEALTLRMRARRGTSGVLRNPGLGGGARGAFDRSGRRDRGSGPLDKAGRRRNGGEGGRTSSGGGVVGVVAQEAKR